MNSVTRHSVFRCLFQLKVSFDVIKYGYTKCRGEFDWLRDRPSLWDLFNRPLFEVRFSPMRSVRIVLTALPNLPALQLCALPPGRLARV